MKIYAKDVLDPTTIGVLDETKGALENIQRQGSLSKTTPWRIPETRPLRTIWSDGESQPNTKSGHTVRGVFSFVWDVRPLDEGKWKGRKYCLLDGIASTLIHIVDEVDGHDRCLARWTVDIGDHQSPGTHCHYQFNGFEVPPFPKSLDVPRLPGFLMSPFLAIEVAIGELFQDRWKKHAFADNSNTNRWRNIQGPRLKRFFEWQARCLERSGSPWMALKLAKPQPELLVSDKSP